MHRRRHIGCMYWDNLSYSCFSQSPRRQLRAGPTPNTAPGNKRKMCNNVQVISVRSHAASGQNGVWAVNTSTRIISAECVFYFSVDAATAAPPLCRLAPPIPCKISIFACGHIGVWAVNSSTCTIFGLKRVFAFICKWTPGQPSRQFVDMHINIFCLQGAQHFNHVALDQWKAAITNFILLAALSLPPIGSISRGWNARLPSEGVIDLSRDFCRPIVLRYNSVPCDSITWLLDLVFKGPVLRHNCRLPVIVTSLYQIHDTFVRIFW